MSTTQIERSPVQAAYPYETELYRQCWWEHMAARFDIPVKSGDLLIHRRHLANRLIHLNELRIAGWNCAWAQDLTLSRLGEMRDMEQTTGWDYFCMSWNEARRSCQAFDALTAGEYLLIDRPAQCHYRIDLSQGFESYWQNLSPHVRNSLERKRRRVALAGSPHLEPCQSEAEIEAWFDTVFPQHIGNRLEKVGHSRFGNSYERAFMMHWAKALHRVGHLVMNRLVMHGETVSLSMDAVYGQHYYCLLTLDTGQYAEYGPGMIGLHLRLQQAAESGITRFNMGPGDDFHQEQSANGREICRELVICNPRSMKGRLYYRWLVRQSAQPVASQLAQLGNRLLSR